MLTMDSDYYRNRSSRRLTTQTSTVSEGLYVGTKELGKSIAEGVAGILVSPYRGWEQGGAVGFGTGIAKGILGVALKPAVGVLDLASRASEGIRNSAMGVDGGEVYELNRSSVYRLRIPRAFGRPPFASSESSLVIVPFCEKAAAAQYLADTLTQFQSTPRLHILHHMFMRRNTNKEVSSDIDVADTAYLDKDDSRPNTLLEQEAWGMSVGRGYVLLVTLDRIVLAYINDAHATPIESPFTTFNELLSSITPPPFIPVSNPSETNVVSSTTPLSSAPPLSHEASSATTSISSLRPSSTTITSTATELRNGEFTIPNPNPYPNPNDNPDKISISATPITSGQPNDQTSSTVSDSNSSPSYMKVHSFPPLDVGMVWSCPASCIDSFHMDVSGDLVLSLNTAVDVTALGGNGMGSSSKWAAPSPMIMEVAAQDYYLMQALFESTLGVELARKQPLAPSRGVGGGEASRITGSLSLLQSVTKHQYLLYGHALYEYTLRPKLDKKVKKASGKVTGGSSQGSVGGGGAEGSATKETERNPEPLEPKIKSEDVVVDLPEPSNLNDVSAKADVEAARRRSFGQVLENSAKDFSNTAVEVTSRVETTVREGVKEGVTASLGLGVGMGEAVTVGVGVTDSDNGDGKGMICVPQDDYVRSRVHSVFKKALKDPDASSTSTSLPAPGGIGGGVGGWVGECPRPPGVLTAVLPLVNIAVTGPVKEDSSGKRFSLVLTSSLATSSFASTFSSLSSSTSSSSTSSSSSSSFLRFLRRPLSDLSQPLSLSEDTRSIRLVFADHNTAAQWRHYIHSHSFTPTQSQNVTLLPPSSLLKSRSRMSAALRMGGLTGNKDGVIEGGNEPPENSISGILVIPSSGSAPSQVEQLKIEIAKTLSR